MQKVNFAFNPRPQLNLNLLAPGLVPTPTLFMADSLPSCGELVTKDSSFKLSIHTDRPPMLTDGL